jgi:hypothetical protein
MALDNALKNSQEPLEILTHSPGCMLVLDDKVDFEKSE